LEFATYRKKGKESTLSFPMRRKIRQGPSGGRNWIGPGDALGNALAISITEVLHDGGRIHRGGGGRERSFFYPEKLKEGKNERRPMFLTSDRGSL